LSVGLGAGISPAYLFSSAAAFVGHGCPEGPCEGSISALVVLANFWQNGF
jgi:hypothetical protein